MSADPASAEIINFQERADARVHRAWEEFLAARDVAMRSNDPWDGIRAGKAWGRFLHLFAPLPGGIVPLPGSRADHRLVMSDGDRA